MKSKLLLSCIVAFLVFWTPGASAAVWQWSVPVEAVTSPETNAPPRAFLWIPPNCRRVRAVLVGQHNLLEEPILEHPALREALGEIGMAEVWVSPAFNPNFRFDQGAGEQFQSMMAALAKESGYAELEFAPVVPIGHSAMASYPYHFGAWNPSRTLAAISVKGAWPDFRNADSPPWKDTDLDGVPLLFATGEYEDAQGRAAKSTDFRRRNPKSPLTMLADTGAGHFDTHTKLANYFGLYLRKVAEYRLPATAPLNAPVPLKSIDPTTFGWLIDRWRKNEAPKAPGAPVGQYTGNKDETFWCFDEEHARATEAYAADYRGKQAQLLGYVQDGELLTQNPKAHQQVNIKFAPIGDGLTFKLTGTFLETVPDGRPVSWSGLPMGSPIGHAADDAAPVIDIMTGPLQKLSEDTFAIRFNRIGPNPRRGGDVWLTLSHRGDAQTKRAVQQALLKIPLSNTIGADQQISFAEIPDQKIGVNSLRLGATSSAGVPVYYYVLAGPAEISGDTLQFTAVPPRTKLPIKVTVVAYQWGRSIEPKLKSAESVTRTFLLTK